MKVKAGMCDGTVRCRGARLLGYWPGNASVVPKILPTAGRGAPAKNLGLMSPRATLEPIQEA